MIFGEVLKALLIDVLRRVKRCGEPSFPRTNPVNPRFVGGPEGNPGVQEVVVRAQVEAGVSCYRRTGGREMF